MKFGLADIVQGAAVPGLLVGTDEVGLLIGTGCNLLRIRRLQRPGGRMLSATDFIRGLPLEIGTQLPSVPMPNLVSDIPFRR